jgi:hypothetical protein
MAKKEYIEQLQQVISDLHKADSTWIGSVPVHESFHGRTIWKGKVEVFNLIGHPKAKRCYGWAQGEPEELITILELPPVIDAWTAVKWGSLSIQKDESKVNAENSN